MRRKIKFIYCKGVKGIKVRHLKGLRVEDILTFSRIHIQIDDFLSVYDYVKEP